MVALAYRGASGDLRLRRLDTAGAQALSLRITDNWQSGGAIITGASAGRVLLAYTESASIGWSANHIVDVALASGQVQDVSLAQGGHHQYEAAMVYRGSELGIAYREEHHMSATIAYGAVMMRRSNLAAQASYDFEAAGFDPATAIGTTSGYLVLGRPNPTYKIKHVDASGRWRATNYETAGDALAFVQGATAPTLVRASNGGMELIMLTAEGVATGVSSVIKAENGVAAVQAQALARGNDVFASWVEGTTARAIRYTAGTTQSLASLTGVTGAAWLLDDGDAVLRVAVRGASVRIERLCP
jgi:hypothetical protein